EVFTVKRERATIKRSYPFALSTQSTTEGKSSLRTLRRILREGRHHNAGSAFRNLRLMIAQVQRILFAMRAHHCRSVSRTWRLSGEHLIRDHSEPVNIRTCVDVSATTLFR